MRNINVPHFLSDSSPMSNPIATIEMASPFKNVGIDVAFHWKNVDFPFLHTHTHWELLLVMQGEIIHKINGVETLYRKGDACLIRPHDKHSLKFPKNHDHNYQQITMTFSNEFTRQILSPHSCYETLLNSPDILYFTLGDAEISSIYDQCLFTQNLALDEYVANTKIIISKLLLFFLEHKLLFNSDYPIWLNNFLTYISNPANFDKPLKELAKVTPYSYSRLATIFKEYVGCPLIDYYTEKKMTYAKRLLQTTTLSVLQIAEKNGYSSLSAFNRQFKFFYNSTPSEYRRKHKQESTG